MSSIQACPRTDTPEWKLLEAKAGSYDAAFIIFSRNNNEVPTLGEIASMFQRSVDLGDDGIPIDKTELIKFLKTRTNTRLFKYNSKTNYISLYKNRLPEAASIIGKINAKAGYPLIKLVGRASNGSNLYEIQERQTEMFDLPSTEPTKIKEGVSELFESNPELANSVYEAMGFGNKKTQIAQVKNNNLTITQYSDESFDVVPDKENILKRTQEIEKEYKEDLKLIDSIIKDFEQGKNVFNQSDNISTIIRNASREYYFNYSTELESFVSEEFNGDEQFASGEREWNPKIYDKIVVRNGIEAGQSKIDKSEIVKELKKGVEKKKEDALSNLAAWESQEGIDRTKREIKYYYDTSEFDERGLYNKELIKSKKGYTLRNLEGGALGSIPGSQGALKGYGYYHNRRDEKQPDAHIFIDRIDETGVYIRYTTVQKEFQGKGIASIMLNRVRQDYPNLPVHRTLITNPIIVKQSSNIKGATDLKGNPLPKFKDDQEIYDWLDNNDHIILPPLNQITPQQKQQAQQKFQEYVNQTGKQDIEGFKKFKSSSEMFDLPSINNVEEFKGFWTREQVAKETNKVFLFGDNTDDRVNTKYVPTSTQAVIRGLTNAIGIDTKKNRGTGNDSYFTDNDFNQFKTQVDEVIQRAKNSGKVIVIPADGIGTGKAMLKEKAPKLFEYLENELNNLKNPQKVEEETAPTTLLEGFDSYYQQKEVVDVIASAAMAYYRDNKDNPDAKSGTYKKAIEQFKDRVSKANETSPKKIYSTILTHIDALSEKSRRKLELLGLVARQKLEGTTLVKETESGEDKIDPESVAPESIGSIQDEWTFQYDSKDNALEAVKKFLAFTPRTVYNEATGFRLIESIVPGQPSFMSYDEVYEQLKSILAGVENTWEAMEAELTKYEKAKPFINTILKRIKNYKEDKEQLKRQLVSTMSSSYSGFKTVLLKEDKNGKKYFDVIDTDRNSVEKAIIGKWQGNIKRSKLFTSTDGNLVIDTEQVKAYLKELKEVDPKTVTKEKISSLLEQVGIELSQGALDQLITGSVNKLNLEGQFTERNGLFKLISLGLTGKNQDSESTEEDDTEVNYSTLTNSAVRGLARVESLNTEYYYSSTFKDGEGNTVYSYTFNKFLTKEFNKLQADTNHVKELLKITFNKPILLDEQPIYESWLYLLDTKPDLFKGVFNIAPFDTVKIAKPGKEGTKLNGMTDLDIELTQLALIQNSGQRKRGFGTHQVGGRVIKYLLTVPSKTTSYIIQSIGHEVKMFFGADGTYGFDKDTINALYSIAASEHNRILSQEARKSDNAAYNKGSKYFFFFPQLNKEGSPELYDSEGKIKLPTDKVGDKTVERIIKEKVVAIVRADIQNKIQAWQKLGIIKNGKLEFVDTNYFNSVVKDYAVDDSNAVTFAAGDYVINSMLAKFNTHQTFIDDPAVYFKKNIKDTWDNVGKRLTNLIAPFKDGMLDENNKQFLSVKLDDRVTTVLNHSQLKARLSKYYEANNIALPYDEIEATDAQEYVTLTEELKVMYMYGEISTNQYNNLLDRIAKDGDDLVLTKEDIEKLFVPKKPVYSNRTVSTEDDAVYRDYVKSASFVLLPQFTKGLEIDKLRKSMEKLEKIKGMSVRAVFNTATKLGGKGSINIWNEDGTIKENVDLTPAAITLDRSNFGIQQEVPYDEDKDEVVRSTQILKLLFDSIQDTTGFRFDGKSYKGEELKELYEKLQNKFYENGRARLEAKLVKDGRLNIPKLITLLRNEGTKRGYSQAQLSFLIGNLQDTDFDIPFWAHVSNDKEQSMLTSLWTNNILKKKMPGSSYVLVSEEGMQGISEGVTYVKAEKVSIVDKELSDYSSETLSKISNETLVGLKTINPVTGEVEIEQTTAEAAIKDLQKQYKQLEDLLLCLNS